VELSTVFSKETLLSRLGRFLQYEQMIVFIGVILYALFAALKISLSNIGTSTALATQRCIMEEVTRFCSSNFRDDASILVAAIH
jgi:hypothetical protein